MSAPAGTVPAMGKSGTAAALYQCSECGWQSTKWAGRCGECQEWGTVAEVRVPARERLLGQARGGQARNGRPTKPRPPVTAAVPLADGDATLARALATRL